ncbi:MAG: TIGR00730 family Rossman fold protein [Candidatus Aminicenantes bacterium]|nr:TIGR00730 family Rossman fold protein [Candidatus Aminicenantes bacterium]
MKTPAVPPIAFKNEAFLSSVQARPLRILSEYSEPEDRFERNKINSTILFVGSARIRPDGKESPLCRYYAEAEELAFRLARWAIPLRPKGKNFVICTGGGPGIMEAANRGAARAGGKSIGMNISLPHEQAPNQYVSDDLGFLFHYFFMRKFWLVSRARAVIAFPGGFGTLDELFETLTLIQTEKIAREEVVFLLYGEEFWREVVNFDVLVKNGTISPEDLKIFTFASTPAKAFSFLKRKLIRYCSIYGPPRFQG